MLLGREATTNLNSILKSRDITLPTKVRLVKAMLFSVVNVRMWELDYKESWALEDLMLFNYGVAEDFWESLCKEIQLVHPKGDQSWIFTGRCWSWSSNTLATWYKELTHWKRPWCWVRLRAGGEWDDRGWDGWMASPTWWT